MKDRKKIEKNVSKRAGKKSSDKLKIISNYLEKTMLGQGWVRDRVKSQGQGQQIDLEDCSEM